MTERPYRWLMTGRGEPFSKTAFDPMPLGPAEVLVDIAGCGVCHTDLGYYYDGVHTNHTLPLALGHEISGRVVDTGVAAQTWIGKAVVVPAVIPCGDCDLCRRGRGAICRHQKMPGNDIQGGFASHVVVPARGLCAVDETRLAAAGLRLADLSVLADAVTTPYQAVVRAGLQVVRAGLQERALVIVVGVGGVGGYAAQICHAFGATVIAIDVDQVKLDALADHGVVLRLNARKHDARDLKKRIRDFAAAEGLPAQEWFIFECSGSAAGQATAFSLLTHGATLCVVGFTRDRVAIRLSNLMAYDARALGNWGCVPELYGDALDLVLDKRIAVAPFVEHHPLESIGKVFQSVHEHKFARRAVLVPAGI